jgi:hypothetical protein
VHVARATDIPSRRTFRCATAGPATALSAGALLLGAGDALAVDSLSVSSTPGAQATVPMTITARGSTSEPSRLRVFVAQGGDCANTAGSASASAATQKLRAGSLEVLSESPSGNFAYAASYTPPAPGSYAVCAYMFRASETSNVSSQVSQGFSVAAAPATPPPTAGDGSGVTGDEPVVAARQCVVPKLKNHTYEGARTLLHRAGCIVGKVAKPDMKKARPLKRGGRRRILKVSTQSSPAGAVRRARAPISLRLKYVTPKS